MQNLDFSNKIKNRPANPREPLSTSDNKSSVDFLGSNRLLLGALIAVILAFTAGLFLGVRIGNKAGPLDSTAALGKKPGSRSLRNLSDRDQTPGNTIPATSGTGSETEPGTEPGGQPGPGPENRHIDENRSSFANQGKPKNLILQLGAYKPANAEKLLIKLSSLPALRTIKPQACRQIDESVPDRWLGFRMKAPRNPSLQRVYMGCFHYESEAQKVLDILIRSGYLKRQNIQLIEFE